MFIPAILTTAPPPHLSTPLQSKTSSKSAAPHCYHFIGALPFLHDFRLTSCPVLHGNDPCPFSFALLPLSSLAVNSKRCHSIFIILDFWAIVDYSLLCPNSLILDSVKPHCSRFPSSSLSSPFLFSLKVLSSLPGHSRLSPRLSHLLMLCFLLKRLHSQTWLYMITCMQMTLIFICSSDFSLNSKLVFSVS